MFTGIVEEQGCVLAIAGNDDRATIRFAARVVLEGTQVGDSISVDGCCLTVTDIDDGEFSVDVMSETLSVTNLNNLDVGNAVNLERAMVIGGRLGGHLVQGHVDATGSVTNLEVLPGATVITIAVPEQLRPYVAPKGSVTVNGVSLTVVAVGEEAFTVSLIPHTLAATTLGSAAVGQTVNLEADMIAKHVAHLLTVGAPSPYSSAEDRQ